MSTLTVCIGNSDDKLTQQDWSVYWLNVRNVVRQHTGQVFGEFLSLPSAPYQNACWVVEGELTEDLWRALAYWAAHFGQDSIAVSVGTTSFVRPPTPEEVAL